MHYSAHPCDVIEEPSSPRVNPGSSDTQPCYTGTDRPDPRPGGRSSRASAAPLVRLLRHQEAAIVSIDYSALLGLSAGILVAKGDYLDTRDGGTIGRADPSAPTLPVGALVVGIIAHTTTAITFSAPGTISVSVETGWPLDVSPALDDISQLYPTTVSQPVTTRQQIPRIDIVGGNVTAGAFDFWILYLPT
jgi:hypothetical protein